MKSRIKYTDEPMGEMKIIKDFFPPPDQLALKEDKVRVTISFSKGSVASAGGDKTAPKDAWIWIAG